MSYFVRFVLRDCDKLLRRQPQTEKARMDTRNMTHPSTKDGVQEPDRWAALFHSLLAGDGWSRWSFDALLDRLERKR
ncbi:MAG: hypothetical protein AAGA71_08455 [Pseudomonadota bacterium]